MNYHRLYSNIIKNAKSEQRFKRAGVYFEKHHILPSCLGGDNSAMNTVLFLKIFMLLQQELQVD